MRNRIGANQTQLTGDEEEEQRVPAMAVTDLNSQDDLDVTASEKDDSPMTPIKFQRLYLLDKESNEWHVFNASEVVIT